MLSGRIKTRSKNESWEKKFDYYMYLRKSNISGEIYCNNKDLFSVVGISHNPGITLKKKVSKVRKHVVYLMHKYLYQDEADLCAALVVGIRGGVNKRTIKLFSSTGTMHVLAISGLHVVFFCFIIFKCLERAGVKDVFKYTILINLVVLFIFFTGARVSVVRAGIMAIIFFLCALMQKKPDILNSLFISAFFIIFFMPGQVLQPGFVFSYLAVLSLIYLRPVYEVLLFRRKNKVKNNSSLKMNKKIKDMFLASLSVWTGIMPVAVLYFNIISPITVITNIVVIPLVFMILVLSYVLIFLDSIAIIQGLCVTIAFLIKNVYRFLMVFLSTFSGCVFTCQGILKNPWWPAIYYIVISITVIFFHKKYINDE